MFTLKKRNDPIIAEPKITATSKNLLAKKPAAPANVRIVSQSTSKGYVSIVMSLRRAL